jgi:tetratricopeptide (TPR) repeat protein
MFARWILALLLSASMAGAIQRPETKTTLRSLTRLPRVEPHFSLDFNADRGFAVLDTSKDPALAAIEVREKLNGTSIDAGTCLEIASLRQAAGDPNATRDFQRAADAFRSRLDLEPGNAAIRIHLAGALHALGRASEAESLLREAIKLRSSSTNQIVFAAFLEARAWEIAADTSNWRGRRPYAELSRRMLHREPSNETMDRAARYLDEALAAAREAVTLEDDSATAQHRLAITLASKNCFETMRRQLSGRDFSAPPADSAIFTEAALPALDKAAEIDPENPTRLATALLWRALSAAAQTRMPLRDPGLWDRLPEETRHRVEDGMEFLQRTGGAASGASAEALGTLRFVLQNDLRGAADDLRRAIGFIPDAEQLWETLQLVLTRNDDEFELAAVCEARVMIRPSVRNRVLLANAHEKLGNRERAIHELDLALALNSSDFAANLSLAALLMRDDDDEDETSPRIRQALINAERAIRTTGSGSQLLDLALTQSIYHGLNDEPERAREILKAALAYDKNDPAIAAALNALGY